LYFVYTMSAVIRQTGRHFLLAIIVVAFALIATKVLYHVDNRLQHHGIMAFFLAGVIVAAWRGGVVPAIFATLLSVLIGAWILPPDNSLRVSDPEDVIRLSLFVFLASLISYMHFTRQRAERSLKESEGRLHFSLDSSGVACWDANVKGGTFWKSHNLPVIFGRTEADFATTYEGFFAYVYPEDREFFHLASVGGGADHRDYEISHRVVCGDGTIRRVSTRGRMYIDEEGRVERMVGAVFAVDNKLANPGSSDASPRMSLGDIASYII
jgi:PAS domain-containing protein